MGNRRIILIQVACIALCSLVLWGVRQRLRFFPAQPEAKAALLERPLQEVDEVTVERGDTRLTVRRRGGRWELAAPFPARVDQGVVARVLDAFEDARVKDALSFQELRRRDLSLKAFGLLSDHARVTLSGGQRRDELRFGAFAPLGNEVYLRLNEAEQVLVVPSELLTVLPRSADDLRSRKLVHGDRALVRSLELRAPGRPFIKLSKETGAWRLVQPAPAPAADAKVERLLDTLFAARVERFVWPTVSNVLDVAETEAALKARLGLYGFGPDTGVQVQWQGAGVEPASKVVFGRPVDGAEELAYVLLQGGEAIGAVSNAVTALFPPSPSELRDTRLFSDLPGPVRRLQIRFGDLLFVLSQTNSVWRLEAPVADLADQQAAADAAERLLRLSAESIDDDAGSEARRVADQQNLPISHVEVSTEQASCRFSIAPDDMENAFYRITFTNSPTVFRVASSNVPPPFVSMLGLLGLRDKTVLALPRRDVRRICVKRERLPAETVQRVPGEAGWSAGEGGGAKPAAKERLAGLLALLESLRADRIEKLGLTPDELDVYGLREPWLEVSVDVEAADAVRKTLLVGKDAGFGKRYAMVRGSDVLFVLDGQTLSGLNVWLSEPE